MDPCIAFRQRHQPTAPSTQETTRKRNLESDSFFFQRAGLGASQDPTGQRNRSKGVFKDIQRTGGEKSLYFKKHLGRRSPFSFYRPASFAILSTGIREKMGECLSPKGKISGRANGAGHRDSLPSPPSPGFGDWLGHGPTLSYPSSSGRGCSSSISGGARSLSRWGLLPHWGRAPLSRPFQSHCLEHVLCPCESAPAKSGPWGFLSICLNAVSMWIQKKITGNIAAFWIKALPAVLNLDRWGHSF